MIKILKKSIQLIEIHIDYLVLTLNPLMQPFNYKVRKITILTLIYEYDREIKFNFHVNQIVILSTKFKFS